MDVEWICDREGLGLLGGIIPAAWRQVAWVDWVYVPHVLAIAKSTPFSLKAASPSHCATAFPCKWSPGKPPRQSVKYGALWEPI